MSDASNPPIDPPHIAELRSRADRTDAVERDNAMLRAGSLGWEPTLAKMFDQVYDGPITPEAIASAAAMVPGLIPAPTAPAPPETTALPDETHQSAERSQLASGQAGGLPAPPVAKPAREAAMEAYDAARKNREHPDMASAAFVSALIKGANDGDKTAVFTSYTPEELGRTGR